MPTLAPKLPKTHRMAENVYHPCLHLFTNFSSEKSLRTHIVRIKQALFGSPSAPTVYKGKNGRLVQFAIQTEFIPTEYSSMSPQAALATLDRRLDLLLDAGFAVHLLLPIHQAPQNAWQGLNWESLTWKGATVFVPYQPTVGDQNGPYEILSEHFHLPIIQHLVQTGRAEKLAAIHVANEFGYSPDGIQDSSKDWGGSLRWKTLRQEALAKTLFRILEKAHQAAQGKVPVGVKFARLNKPETAWTPHSASQTDWLAWFLQEAAQLQSILGYDVYFPNGVTAYDAENRKRLLPFLPLFSNGYFEVAETGRECQGAPGQFNAGKRTSAKDVLGVHQFWPESRCTNLFAWNASNPWTGCFALYDETKGQLYPGAKDALDGLWASVNKFLEK